MRATSAGVCSDADWHSGAPAVWLRFAIAGGLGTRSPRGKAGKGLLAHLW
jgi:hypothetical protein